MDYIRVTKRRMHRRRSQRMQCFVTDSILRMNGRFLKSIKFRFPVYYNGVETQEMIFSDNGWDYQRSLETVVLLFKGNI